MPGFRYIPYNDLEAARAAISPATVAILIEGIQGEGGVTPATPEYLLGLRKLCDEKGLLLLMDGVQDGHFRTGRFQSFQRILEGVPGGDQFLPDGISMAKSIAGGIPMGAFWARKPYGDLLGPGSHATTFGGTPLACAVALKVLEVVERDHLADHVRELGNHIKSELERISNKYPTVIKSVRGLGLMVGFQLADGIRGFAGQEKPPGIQFVNRLHEAGILTIPSGTHVVRILPPLNLTAAEAAEGLKVIESIASELAS
jgi:acetylornithine aminotransferase/acetylornithine/N-succinyldiaminopimelate aminotransferase